MERSNVRLTSRPRITDAFIGLNGRLSGFRQETPPAAGEYRQMKLERKPLSSQRICNY